MMMKIMKSSVAIIFVVTLLISGSVLAFAAQPWSQIKGAEHNMVAYGKVAIDGADFAARNYMLYGFGQQGDQDCRSVSEIKADGSYYATIVGNTEGEKINFKVTDATVETYILAGYLIFIPDETKDNFNIR
jgi:hypothetical protein